MSGNRAANTLCGAETRSAVAESIAQSGCLPAFCVSDNFIPDTRVNRRRRVSHQCGKALEMLSRAIEYLADDCAFHGGVFATVSLQDPQVQAIQILIPVRKNACTKLSLRKKHKLVMLYGSVKVVHAFPVTRYCLRRVSVPKSFSFRPVQTAMRRTRWLYVALVAVGRTIDARCLFARCVKHKNAADVVLVSACMRCRPGAHRELGQVAISVPHLVK